MFAKRSPIRRQTVPARRFEKGGALLVAVVITIPIIGFSASMLFLSIHYSDQIVSDRSRSRSINTAEIGVALAVEDLVAGGAGNISGTVAGGKGSFSVTTVGEGDEMFEVLSQGSDEGEDRLIEAGVGLIPVETVNVTLGGAVVANSDVSVTGNNTIDGRDWDELGQDVVGQGVFGVQTTSAASRGGNAKIGGNGIPPAKNLNETEQNYFWADGVDDDSDGDVDEEPFDGIDNDNDGLIDEDPSDFPENPDALVGLSPGSLKKAAISYGTYFTNGSDLDAYASANGGLPGGKVYYLETSDYGPVNWDMDLNDEPAVLVIHNVTGDATVKNWHADFKGLLITGKFDKFNGTPIILGAVVTLTPDSGGAMFANAPGDARVANRAYQSPTSKNIVGFRVVAVPKR